jgi:hypothetical protein
MRLFEIFSWVFLGTVLMWAIVMILIALGGSKRKYERFTPEELRALEDFQSQQRGSPKP